MLDSKPGVYTYYHPFLHKDKTILKKLLKGIQTKRPGEVQTALLRRHLLELTQSFMIPLERYMASLMPLQKNISPYKVSVFFLFLWYKLSCRIPSCKPLWKLSCVIVPINIFNILPCFNFFWSFTVVINYKTALNVRHFSSEKEFNRKLLLFPRWSLHIFSYFTT